MPLGTAVAQAFADLFGASLAEGGAIAGALFSVAVFLVFLIISSRLEGGAIPAFAGFLVGAVISVMLDWWDEWTILVAALLLAVAVVGPLSNKGGA